MNLNELRDKAYQCAIAHGWHEEEHSNDHWLCLIISELMEAVQADRKGKRARPDYYKTAIENSLICKGLDKTISKETGYKVHYEEWIKDTVEDELSDTCIRLLDLAGLRNIDIYDLTEEDIDDDSEDFVSKSFTEGIYYISTILLKKPFNLHCKLNRMLSAIFGLAKHLNINILWHINKKMEYNELRPYKHGKRY